MTKMSNQRFRMLRTVAFGAAHYQHEKLQDDLSHADFQEDCTLTDFMRADDQMVPSVKQLGIDNQNYDDNDDGSEEDCIAQVNPLSHDEALFKNPPPD